MAFGLSNIGKKRGKELSDKSQKSKHSGNKILKFIVMFLPLFTWATIGVIITIALFLFIIPLYKDTFQITKVKIERKEIEVLEKEKELIILKKTKEDYDTITKEELTKMANIIPVEQNIPVLISQLNALVQSAGLELMTFDINTGGDKEKGRKKKKKEEEEDNSGIKELNITLTTSGGYYEDFKKILTAFEDNLRLFEVISVGYIPPLTEIEAEESIFSFNLKTFYRENPLEDEVRRPER